MPIYEYRCTTGHKVEAFRSVDARHDCPLCPCGATSQKIISTPPRVFSDFEGYVSPASGKWINGKSARREDFARTGTRPYESGEAEAKSRQREAENEQFDNWIADAAEETLHELTH